MSPYEELTRTFKLKVQADEDFETFAARASDRVNKCTDAQWKELSEELQTWTNDTMKVRDANMKDANEPPAPLPELEGFPVPGDDEPGEDAAEEEASDDAEEPAEEEASGEEAEHDAETGEVDEGGVDEEATEEQDAKEAPRRQVARGNKDKEAKTGKGKDKTMSTAAAAKRAPAPTPAKKAAAPKGATRRGIGDNDVIKVLVKENPYRDGSIGHKVFAKYKDGAKVKDFAAKAKALDLTRPPAAMLRFDEGKGYIKIVPAG